MNAIDVLDHGILKLQALFTNDFKVRVSTTDKSVSKHKVNGTLQLNGTDYPCVAITHRGIAPLRDLNAGWKREEQKAPVFFVPLLAGAERTACRKEGIFFVDTQGNCFLDLPGCHINVSEDHPPQHRLMPTGKAFQTGGLLFLLAIYRKPELLNQPYRKISTATGISTGALTAIFEDLRANDFLREDPQSGSFSLLNELDLVRRFAYNYLTDVRPKLSRGLFYLATHDTLERLQNTDAEVPLLMGGQHAASIRGKYLSSPVFTLHTDARIVDLAKSYRIVPVGTKVKSDRPTVEIFNTFGGRHAVGQKGNISLVNDLLIYADLLNSHDVRVLDAAERLLTHEISDKFRENWLRYGGTPGVLSVT
jgi:hypothetical protein